MDVSIMLGWPGMLLILLAYALRTRLSLLAYAMMNLVGSTFLGIVVYGEWSVFALQVAWAAVALRDLWCVAAKRGRVGEDRGAA